MPRHQAVSRSRTFTRVRAVLAGALVLGVGSTMTLAAWTDNEFGQGTFTASRFDTQSSVNGGVGYADNSSSPGATIAFDTTAMSPSSVRYGSLLVRTKINSIAGTMVLSGATISPSGTDETTVLGAALRYRVVSTTATCDATAFTGSPTWVVGPTAATLTTAGSATLNLAAATASLPGAATGLCFEVTLPAGAANTLQGASTTAIWHVTATSS